MNKEIQTLNDIKNMMQKSSRFISLSGWSGISAGLCALFGALAANNRIQKYYKNEYGRGETSPNDLLKELIIIGVVVFLLAFSTALFFTLRNSKKQGIKIWGQAAQRLMWNTMLPMLVGGILILRLMQVNEWTFIAPACLIFYGLALVNGSKYTLGEVRYLGYGQLILGAVSLWFPYYGILFWAIGFGVLHIFYGAIMWWKYERNQENK